MHEAEEANGSLFIPGGQAWEVLEAAEKTFYPIALPVAHPVDEAAAQAAFLAGNHDLGPQLFDLRDHRIRVVAFVSQHVARLRHGRQQLRRPFTVGLLAAALQQGVRPAVLVHGRVQLGAQPAATAAERLVAGALFFT
nr:hypothetical protein [Hymenobacter baengnokdamensis]